MKPFVRLCVSAALASLFAPAALADGLYMRLGAGYVHVDEDSFTNAEFDDGYLVSGSIGYNWFFPDNIADLRIELEGAYRDTDLDSISGNSANGDAEVYTAMVNGIVDIRTNWVVVPYLGVGFGAAHVKFESDGGGVLATIDDDDTVFAYQVMAGLNYDLSENLAIGFEYRFLETEDFEMTNSAATQFETDYMAHAAMITLTFGF